MKKKRNNFEIQKAFIYQIYKKFNSQQICFHFSWNNKYDILKVEINRFSPHWPTNHFLALLFFIIRIKLILNSIFLNKLLTRVEEIRLQIKQFSCSAPIINYLKFSNFFVRIYFSDQNFLFVFIIFYSTLCAADHNFLNF